MSPKQLLCEATSALAFRTVTMRPASRALDAGRAKKRSKLLHPADPEYGADQPLSMPSMSKAPKKRGPSVGDDDELSAKTRHAKQRERHGGHREDDRASASTGGPSDPASLRSFEFEQLPPEVRTMIYKLLFIKDYPIRPLCREERYFENHGTSHRPDLEFAINLLRVCRLVNAEASDILYGRNNFLLYSVDFGDAVLAFLETIGSQNRRAIRTLSIDWQHGIVKINQASRAADLIQMISDRNNPLRNHVRKMLHDVGRSTILKFVATLELMIGSSRLEYLTIVCPGNENPGHPDNHCVEYHDCPGCHHEVPRCLARMKGLKSLTVGDTDWHNELEVLAIAMETKTLHITQMDVIDMPEETALELEEQGWSVRVTWRVPDGDHFRRVITKKLRTPEGVLLHDFTPEKIKKWW